MQFYIININIKYILLTVCFLTLCCHTIGHMYVIFVNYTYMIHSGIKKNLHFYTHVFFLQVKQMVNGILHILWQTCDCNLVWIFRAWLRKPYIDLKSTII